MDIPRTNLYTNKSFRTYLFHCYLNLFGGIKVFYVFISKEKSLSELQPFSFSVSKKMLEKSWLSLMTYISPESDWGHYFDKYLSHLLTPTPKKGSLEEENWINTSESVMWVISKILKKRTVLIQFWFNALHWFKISWLMLAYLIYRELWNASIIE